MNTHSLEIIPRHSEVDVNGQVKLRAVFDYLQEAAAQHADILGCGMRFLAEYKRIWVLSRMRLEFLRPLLLGEELLLETYPRGFEKLFALRPLVIRDKKGGDVVRALSAWLLLDTEKGRILRPEGSLNVPLPDNSALPGFFEGLQKPEAPENLPPEPLFSSVTRDAQIDLNRHMNNAEYALHTHSALALLLGKTPVFRELTVNYARATKAGETLEWRAVLKDGGKFFVKAQSRDGAEHFSACGLLAP